jgi:hypothetical protein
MSSTKIYPFNTLQLRLANQLIMYDGVGRKTDALAIQVGCSPSEVSFELLKLRERGYVSSLYDGSAYVTWYSSPGLVDALRRYTLSKLQQCTEDTAPKQPVQAKVVNYLVKGPVGYRMETYARESDALREAKRRAEAAPKEKVAVYVLHKTVLKQPEQRIPGELIVE